MHKQLERQIRKASRDREDGSLDVDLLLQLVDQSYEEADRERRVSRLAANLMEQELRAANQQARETAEKHLKAILDTVGEGVIIADRRGIIVDANKAAQSMLGYDPGELAGKNLAILMGASDAEQHDRHMDRYERTRDPRVIGRGREETARRKNGDLFPIELAVGDLIQAGVPQFVGIMRDISERKKAQEKLERSEQLFRDFAQSSSDWFWETDHEHKFSQFIGYSPTLEVLMLQGLIGKTRLELMAEATDPAVIENHRVVLEAHQPFRDLKYSVFGKDGGVRIICVSGKPVFDSDGVFQGYRGTARDITGEVSTDQRLKALEAQLLAAISSISEGFVLYDKDDRLAMCNDRYRGLFPKSSDAIQRGALFSDIIHTAAMRGSYAVPKDKLDAWVAERIRRHTQADGKPFTQELATGRWLRSVEYPTRDGGIVGIHTDITEQVRLEQELRGAKEQAEAASRAKSEFLATMSHEIRTPMNGIIGMTGLLLDTALNEEQRHFANTVRVSSESLLTIINDILDFSKMEAGRLELEEGPFEIRPLVEGVIDILTPRVKAKPVELTYLVPPTAHGVFSGDAGRLRQVLLNLAGNAVKFTEKGAIAIEVAVLRDDAGGHRMRLEVRDTGVGIPAEAQPKLFSMFTQADSSTARRFGGTGLGLAISRRIVELMGGEIGFSSQYGSGSSFWFEVPLEKTDDEPEDVDNALLGLRVLVVDDIPTNTEVFSRQLSSWGADADVASDAASGLIAIRQAQTQGRGYGVILLDHHMPGMSGLDLAAVLRADPSLADLRIILATSGVTGNMAETAGRLRLDAVLPKPVRQSTLLDRLMDIKIGPVAAEMRRKPQRDLGDDETLPTGSALRILVAEDNAINQQVAVGLLAKLGHRADVADDGGEALTLVERGDYDLVLMDMQMPGMDGIAATKAIRALPGPKAAMPIIAMTANAMTGDRELCLAAGMDDYIAKPIDRRRLATTLERWSEHILADRANRRGCTLAAPPEVVAAADPGLLLTPLIDVEARRDLADTLGEESFSSLMSSFYASLPTRLREIEAAHVTADLEALAKAAHSLRGAASNLGLSRLGGLLDRLERAAKDNDPAAARPLFDQVVEAADQTLAVLLQMPPPSGT